MELHYAIVTVLLVVLVLILGFVVVSMFLPVYQGSRGSPLFNSTVSPVSKTRSISSSKTPYTSTVSSTISTTTTLFTSPPSGRLRVKSYHIRVEDETIRVGLVFLNTYPVEVIVEKIYLNDTLVYSNSRVIDPWSEISKIAGSNPSLAESMTITWINTGIKPASNSEIIVCGKTITVGNLTIIYKITNVEGTYNITLPLKLPECMIKTYTIEFPPPP